MHRTLSVVVLLAVGLFTTGCPPTRRCTPQSCATGCCSASDTCETGDTQMACGTAGARCDTCISSQVCSSGRCMAVSGTGGGSGGGATGGGMGGGSAGGASSDTITGTYQAVFGWDGDGGRAPSIDTTRATIGVWFRDAGSPDFVRGTITAAGTFSVSNVPAGEVTLQLGDRYIVTTERRVNFDFAAGGRIDATQATLESQARFTIDGLAPLDDTHSLSVFFTQGESTAFNLETVAVPPTANGATTFASDLDWRAVSRGVQVGLPDATKGDLGWAFQNQSIATDAGVTSTIIRAAALPPFTLTNGGVSDIAATFTAPPTSTWTIAIDRGAYEALRGSVGRETGAAQWSFEVGTSPATEARNSIHSAFALGSALVNEPAPPPASLVYATPFPSTWARTAEVTYFVRQTRTPAGGMPVSFVGGVRSVMPLAMATSGTIGLPISPVRGAQIASRNFTEDQTGIGLTPTLAWMAPATGTVTTYRVSVFRLALNGEVAQLTRIYTKNPGVTLPPGMLTAGQPYVMQIEAMRWVEGPVYFGLPFAFSIVVSGLLTP